MIAFLDLVYYRRAGWALRILPVGIAGVCFAGWMLIAITTLGPGAFADNLALTRKAAGGAIFVFDPQATIRALRYMIQPYGGLLIPALLYGLWRSRTRDAAALAELPLILLPLLWLAWYVISLGWPRYAFPAVALGAFAVARLLIDVVAGLRSRKRPLLATLVVLYAAAAIVTPLSISATRLLQPADAAYRMGAYLRANVPFNTVVETWEPELGVITDHTYHYPPTAILDDAVRGEWLAGNGAQYPLPTDPPAYLVIGPFGAYTGVYNQWLAAADYRMRTEIGPYVLFELQP
ncbi:MAG: hypothetical protein HC822_14560 [Oscillochloris sp.]|nr:hypothetical protein [Oscillochloris sp.]